MSQPVKFQCPHCRKFLVARYHFGVLSMCPRCGRQIMMPQQPSETTVTEPGALIDPYAGLRRRIGVAS